VLRAVSALEATLASSYPESFRPPTVAAGATRA